MRFLPARIGCVVFLAAALCIGCGPSAEVIKAQAARSAEMAVAATSADEAAARERAAVEELAQAQAAEKARELLLEHDALLDAVRVTEEYETHSFGSALAFLAHVEVNALGTLSALSDAVAEDASLTDRDQEDICVFLRYYICGINNEDLYGIEENGTGKVTRDWGQKYQNLTSNFLVLSGMELSQAYDDPSLDTLGVDMETQPVSLTGFPRADVDLEVQLLFAEAVLRTSLLGPLAEGAVLSLRAFRSPEEFANLSLRCVSMQSITKSSLRQLIALAGLGTLQLSTREKVVLLGFAERCVGTERYAGISTGLGGKKSENDELVISFIAQESDESVRNLAQYVRAKMGEQQQRLADAS